VLFKRPLSDVRKDIHSTFVRGNPPPRDGSNFAGDYDQGNFPPDDMSYGTRRFSTLKRSLSPDDLISSSQISRGSRMTSSQRLRSLERGLDSSSRESASSLPGNLDVNVSMVLNEGQRRCVGVCVYMCVFTCERF
jgi:hypothetical protein